MGVLENLITGTKLKPRKIVIYGVDGIGKTTLASKSPNPVFLATEDGQNDIGCPRTPLVTSFDQFNAYTSDFITGDHDYQTLVLDSADWAERLIHKAIARKADKSSIEEIGYGKGYKMAIEGWSFVLNAFDELVRQNMNIIILAHAKVEKFSPPDGDQYDRYELALHKTAAPIIREWADEVFFANYDVTTLKKDDSFGAERHQAVSQRRVLYTCEAPTHMAKRRVQLPDVMPMEWGEYAKNFPQNKTGNIEGIVKGGSSKTSTKEKETANG